MVFLGFLTYFAASSIGPTTNRRQLILAEVHKGMYLAFVRLMTGQFTTEFLNQFNPKFIVSGLI